MRTSVGSADVASLQEQNHYERLGLSNDADSVVIKRAYRKACLRFHPDKARAEDREYATECMQMISQAHTILNDPMKRAAYDRWLEYGAAEGTAFNENDDGGIPWSEDGGIVGTLTNVVLLTLLAARTGLPTPLFILPPFSRATLLTAVPWGVVARKVLPSPAFASLYLLLGPSVSSSHRPIGVLT
eukprot:m.127591 g.127591  ORF g.127591 m.127591 type:complete len:186 (-) comp13603_c0_seq2:47-604(-)